MTHATSSAPGIWKRVRLALLRALLRAAPSERQRVFVLTILVGVLSGLAAVLFHVALQRAERLFATAVWPPSGATAAWIIVIPTLGGLLCGFVLQRVLPEARGSGIPQVKAAYATTGHVPLRVAVGKFFVSLVQIGSGASLGREGPTVQICAGVASAVGGAGALSKRAIRRLLPVGAAAGVAAAFNAPIAAVTFAIEEIVGDLDQAVLSGVVIAAAVAAAIERSILGSHPVFRISGEYALEHWSALVLYALLGVAAGVVSLVFTDSLLKLRAWFKTTRRVPVWAAPAVGGFVTGVMAWIAYSTVGASGVTGGGYATLAEALTGGLALKIVLGLLVFKFIATVFSYSSGGAGGIFAPTLFLGAMLGSVFGHLDQMMFDRVSEGTGAFALVGMGAFFAATVRAPITSVLIIFEMTDGYGLILPLMMANMTAYRIARVSRPMGIYDALLHQDGIELPHGSRNPLAGVPVEAVMTTGFVALDPESRTDDAVAKLEEYEYATYPVLSGDGRFMGFVNRYALVRALEQGEGMRPVADFVEISRPVNPQTTLQRAAARLHETGTHLLAVVESGDGERFVGLLTSSDIVRAHATLTPGEKH